VPKGAGQQTHLSPPTISISLSQSLYYALRLSHTFKACTHADPPKDTWPL